MEKVDKILLYILFPLRKSKILNLENNNKQIIIYLLSIKTIFKNNKLSKDLSSKNKIEILTSARLRG